MRPVQLQARASIFVAAVLTAAWASRASADEVAPQAPPAQPAPQAPAQSQPLPPLPPLPPLAHPLTGDQAETAPPTAPEASPGVYGAPPGAVVMPPGYLEHPGRWPRRVVPKDASQPPPLGYHRTRVPITALWVSGLSILTATTGVASFAGGIIAGEGEGGGVGLFVPIVGPFVFGALVDKSSSEEPLIYSLVTLLSVAQGTGLALLIAGVAAPKSGYERNDVLEAPTVRARVGLGVTGGSFTLEF